MWVVGGGGLLSGGARDPRTMADPSGLVPAPIWRRTSDQEPPTPSLWVCALQGSPAVLESGEMGGLYCNVAPGGWRCGCVSGSEGRGEGGPGQRGPAEMKTKATPWHPLTRNGVHWVFLFRRSIEAPVESGIRELFFIWANFFLPRFCRSIAGFFGHSTHITSSLCCRHHVPVAKSAAGPQFAW